MNVRAVIAIFILAGVALAATVWVGGDVRSKESKAKETVASSDPERTISLDEEAPFPKAVMDETTYEFGDMELGSKQQHTFILKNEGEDVLKIEKGGSTCKCTVSDLPSNEIAPGESAEILLEWEPKSASTTFGQQARIHTNDPENKLITLEIRGKVFDTISIQPAEDLNVGNIQEGVGADARMSYFSRILPALEEPKIEYDGDKLEFEITPLDVADLPEFEAKSGYAIAVHAKPNMPVGSFRESFTLVYELKGEEVREKKTVAGKRLGPIRFLNTAGTTFYEEISLVDFGRFDASQGKKQEVILIVENPESGKVEITDITSEHPLLKVTHEPNKQLKLKNRSSFRLFFEVTAGSPPIDVARKSAPEIIIKTDHPDVPEIVMHAEIHSR